MQNNINKYILNIDKISITIGEGGSLKAPHSAQASCGKVKDFKPKAIKECAFTDGTMANGLRGDDGHNDDIDCEICSVTCNNVGCSSSGNGCSDYNEPWSDNGCRCSTEIANNCLTNDVI